VLAQLGSLRRKYILEGLRTHEANIKDIPSSILSRGLAEIHKKVRDKLRKGVDRPQIDLYASGDLLSAVLASRASDTQSYMRPLFF